MDVPLEEKVRLLTGATMFTLWDGPDLGLTALALSDGPTGVRGLKFAGGARSALLPNATLLAAAWDEDLMAEVGTVLADEAERQHIHVVLGPTINLHRSPLGGRLFEAFAEDPLLTGRLAAAYVHGVQGRGIGACLKHLVANESETERNTADMRVDEATLRELYLLPFEIAIHDAQPWSLMAAYNDVNGVPATEQHHVMTEVVKDAWGYDGLIMSDWFATKSTAASINGGLDLVMPGPHGPWGEALVEAVRAGEVPAERVDDALDRLLRLAGRVGGLGGGRQWAQVPAPDSSERQEQLRRLAAAGMTVLTNDGTLPLGDGRVALIGRHAVDTVLMGGGSAQVNPARWVTIADALGAATVVDGVEVRTRPVPARPPFITDPSAGEPGMRVSLGGTEQHVSEGRYFVDRTEFETPPERVRMQARVGHDGPIEVGLLGLGRFTVRAGDGEHTGELTPSGHDPGEAVLKPPAWTTVIDGPVDLDVTIELTEAPHALVALVARPAPRTDDEVIADAVAAARDADVAVVVVGLTEEQETEASDKSTLRLPGAQDRLVSEVAAAADRTVVVVNAASPVLMPWLAEVDAVVHVGLPGQEGGAAVAAVLRGDLEPSGRLVTTFPAEDGAAPAWSVTPVDGVLGYAEGPFIGYRGHHAGRGGQPLFWFGHGLGYGSWEYRSADLAGDTITVTLANTGGRRSREVVQAYFAPADASQPIRLAGWAATTLDPGAEATVSVPLDRRALRRWDGSGWADLGDGDWLIARGLGDVRLRVDGAAVAQ